MHIKRYEAPTMVEAVRRVREELGPDALILSTRTVRKDRGLFGRLGRGIVEVTAGVDRDVRAGRSSLPGRRVAPDPSWNGLRLTRALVEPLEDEVRRLRGSLEALGAPLESGRHIESELAELRCLVADLRREVAGQGHEAATEACAGSFLAAGIAPRHAFALGAEAARNGADRPEEAADILCQTLARRLDAKLATPRPDRPEVVMYVGASGVGKTTTLAKIAGRARDEDRKVAVVSTDTFRVGAEAQLRTVAERLDVPFQMAISPTHLEGVVRGVRRRRVLVDTAGRSRTDRAAVEELCRYREALGQRLKVHLVLSATTKEEDLRAELRRFACLQPEALVVTRLDESARLGNVANLLLDDGAPPLAWFADGQRVPEDLAVPDPAEFAASVLGGTP